MTNRTAANRYARALLEVAVKERADVEQIETELAAFTDLFKQHPALEKVLLNPAVPTPRKRGALEAIGISAHVPGEWSGSFSGLYGGLPRQSELRVFESDRDRALVELRRLQIRIVPPKHQA